MVFGKAGRQAVCCVGCKLLRWRSAACQSAASHPASSAGPPVVVCQLERPLQGRHVVQGGGGLQRPRLLVSAQKLLDEAQADAVCLKLQAGRGRQRQAGGRQVGRRSVDEAQADAVCLKLQADRQVGRQAVRQGNRQAAWQSACSQCGAGHADMQAWRRAGVLAGYQPSTPPLLTDLPTRCTPTCALCTAASSSAASSPSLASAAAAL